MGLNYKGKPAFKTAAGGFVSMVLQAFLISLYVIKFLAMYQYKNWTIIQQEIVTDFESIKQLQEFKKYTNISIAV